MSGNDMNAEQGGSTPEGDFSPVDTGSAEAKDVNQPDSVEAPTGDSFSKISSETTKDDSDSSEIERVRQDLRFDSKGNFVLTPATAGGLGLENDDPKSSRVLQAHVPGRPAGGRGATGRAGATGGRNPLGGIRGRIAAAVVVIGGLLGGGAAYVANQSADSGDRNPGGVPTQPVGETPDVETAEPTRKPTEQPKTPTPEPTPTEVAPGPGSHGKYETIDQLFEDTDFNEEERDAIKELTEGCIPQIITEEGMICIEEGLIDAPSQITLHDGKVANMSQIHSIRLDTVKFPNAIEMFNQFIRRDKYNAWKNQSGRKDVSYEQYLEEESQGIKHEFEVGEYQGDLKSPKIHILDGDSYMIYKFLADDAKTDRIVNVSTLARLEHSAESKGGVLATGILHNKGADIGSVYPNGAPIQPHRISVLLALAAAYHGIEVKDIVLGKYFMNTGDFNFAKNSYDELSRTLTPNWPEDLTVLPSPEADIDDIFIAEGTSLSNNQ